MSALYSTPGVANLEALGVSKTASALNAAPEVVAVPASATATGTAGQIAFASGTLYVCIATDTWEKVTIATWA